MDAKLDKQERSLKHQIQKMNLKLVILERFFQIQDSWLIAGLCTVLFSNFSIPTIRSADVSSKLMVEEAIASRYVSMFPIGAMILTPFIGYFLDKKV